MITTIALLLTSMDPVGFNPHLATCWTDPGCASEHMGGRDERNDTSREMAGRSAGLAEQGGRTGTLRGSEHSGRLDTSGETANPHCSGDLTTDRRCLGTPRAELGEGIELSGNSGRFASGTQYPAYDATGMGDGGMDQSPGVDCGPGDKLWPLCVRTDPAIYFPPMRNGYLGHLSADFREQLRSELLRPDEPPVQILDGHTFLIRRDQLAYFAVLWRLCPSCVEVRDALHNMRQGIRDNPFAPLSVEGRGLQAGQAVLSELRSDALLLTWHRPHNWRQYAEKRHITELMPPRGSNTPENRETIAGLVLSPHDLEYEYVGRNQGAVSGNSEHDIRPGDLSATERSVRLSAPQEHCAQYCGDRGPLEMQYDFIARTATTGTRPGVVEPVVASSLPAAQLLILEVARDHWQEVIDANAAVDRWLGIPTIEPSRDDWPDMGLFQHLMPADRRGESEQHE